jgi:hypothetical protein
MRTAGMDVELHMVGDTRPGSAHCVTIYRIVQEALTNAMRHAPGSHVTITLRTGDGYEIVVEDDGPHGDAAANLAGGFGLAGLAERVEALGGQFTAGPPPGRRLLRARTVARRSTRGGRRLIRVVIADDQALIRGGLRAILEAEHDIEIVAEASDGAAAAAAASATADPHAASP